MNIIREFLNEPAETIIPAVVGPLLGLAITILIVVAFINSAKK